VAFQTPPEIKAFFARMVRHGGALSPEKPRYGRAAVGLFPPRPIRPDLPPELIAELALFSRDKLIDIRSYPHPSIPLIYRSIDRKQLEAWIVWLAADEAWREARLYRVALWGMRAAMAAALISLASWLFPIGCNRP
jgi:hypothetical protein